MSIFEFALTYLVSWWVLLFMVLPFWVKTADNPVVGHAPSAPENPQLKRKFWVTTALAFIPPLLIMSIAPAKAESGIYTTKSTKCAKLKPYVTPSDLAAVDSNATLNPQSTVNTDSIKMNLNLPVQNYIDPGKYNADFSETQIGMGAIEVKKDGSATLAGQPIGGTDTFDEACKDGE